MLLSNGREHWFWNLERATERDAYRIERLPPRKDLERVQLKNLQPAKLLQTQIVHPDFLTALKSEVTLCRYQIDAMEAIAKEYDTEGKRQFLLEMATGTGKTLLCAALIQLFHADLYNRWITSVYGFSLLRICVALAARLPFSCLTCGNFFVDSWREHRGSKFTSMPLCHVW